MTRQMTVLQVDKETGVYCLSLGEVDGKEVKICQVVNIVDFYFDEKYTLNGFQAEIGKM